MMANTITRSDVRKVEGQWGGFDIQIKATGEVIGKLKKGHTSWAPWVLFHPVTGEKVDGRLQADLIDRAVDLYNAANRAEEAAEEAPAQAPAKSPAQEILETQGRWMVGIEAQALNNHAEMIDQLRRLADELEERLSREERSTSEAPNASNIAVQINRSVEAVQRFGTSHAMSNLTSANHRLIASLGRYETACLIVNGE